jgi:valyl-tRNA synthetase
VVRLIGLVRSVRTEMTVPPAALAPILLRDASAETLARAERWIEAIRRMARASEVRLLDGAMPAGSVQMVLDEAIVVLPLEGLIDVAAERKRLAGARDKALAEGQKIALKLANVDFVSRAKPEVVEENRERLAAFQAEAARLEAALARIE